MAIGRRIESRERELMIKMPTTKPEVEWSWFGVRQFHYIPQSVCFLVSLLKFTNLIGVPLYRRLIFPKIYSIYCSTPSQIKLSNLGEQ